jgi:hypothetical protein
MKVRTFLIVAVVLAVVGGMTTINITLAQQNRGSTSQATLKTLQLTELEEQNILFMREEEKLARDVYLVMYDLWGANIFANISESEQRHMDAIERLITRYGLTDPVVDDDPEADDVIGVFTDPDLQKLYDDLVDAGEASLEAALKVGVMIEEKDIADLEQALTETEKRNIQRVFQNLLNGSYNHLDAFNACLDGDCICLPNI